MRKERKVIKVSELYQNIGQLPWLPKNPRQWTQEDVDKTAASIREDEDFLEDRPLLVCMDAPHKWVVFAGNLRLTAAQQIGINEVPCVIYYATDPNTDFETIKRRAMKDNGSFGSWDFDALANEWDDLPLADWGVPAWETKVDEAMDGAPGGPGGSATEDDFDEAKDHIVVKCKPGDIWELGPHRLMCGDSIDLEQVKALMGGGCVS